MPFTRHGTSLWLHRSPKAARAARPRHRGHLDIDVAIVGGGLTGCAVGYAFAVAGARTAIFEAGRVGEGSTALSSGLVLPSPAAGFEQIAGMYGLRSARSVFEASRRAALELGATLRRLGVRCDLDPRRFLTIARSTGQEKALRRETMARRAAGLDASWMPPRRVRAETAVEGHGALGLTGGAQLDPVRACLGFARGASARGALIFERSAVRRARAARGRVEITTDGGTVRAGTIVVATNRPEGDFRPLRRHFTPVETYMVVTEPLPGVIRRQLGKRAAILSDAASLPHHLAWLRDDRVLFSGADQPETPARSRDKVVVQRTGQLMYELSTMYPAISGLRPEFGWAAPYVHTADGLPVLGPHRNYPRHLFALGIGGSSLAHAFLAGRILVRHYRGQPDKSDALFSFARA